MATCEGVGYTRSDLPARGNMRATDPQGLGESTIRLFVYWVFAPIFHDSTSTHMIRLSQTRRLPAKRERDPRGGGWPRTTVITMVYCSLFYMDYYVIMVLCTWTTMSTYLQNYAGPRVGTPFVKVSHVRCHRLYLRVYTSGNYGKVEKCHVPPQLVCLRHLRRIL